MEIPRLWAAADHTGMAQLGQRWSQSAVPKVENSCCWDRVVPVKEAPKICSAPASKIQVNRLTEEEEDEEDKDEKDMKNMKDMKI
ncbi:hypothetical protein WISP_64194 [Willisornis vidua]|uniref:Uncharacterized protein n=1 Tax=Willisornis vidua TaxID=1566151 RepID=A0ABQ9DFP0_9PASS|nr:hypothetical protein WISP_64194 [Willisornis vidua]